MTPLNALLLTYGLSVLLSLLAGGMLWRPLDQLLTEQCGTVPRARFWTVWSVVMICVLPLFIAPLRAVASDPMLVVKSAVSSALLGILLAVLGMGYAIWSRTPRPADA